MRLGFGGDQVVHGFGLNQIHAAVQEGATGELAGVGWAQARLGQRLRHAVDDRAAAMQMQFGTVLAGVAAGAGEPQDQGLIQNCAGPVAQPAK